MNRLLIALLGLLLVAHQDVWNWDELVWIGPLPLGFAYHLAFCVAVAVVMWALVRHERAAGEESATEADES